MGGAGVAPTYTVIGTEYFISQVHRRRYSKGWADGELGSGLGLWDFEYRTFTKRSTICYVIDT